MLTENQLLDIEVNNIPPEEARRLLIEAAREAIDADFLYEQALEDLKDARDDIKRLQADLDAANDRAEQLEAEAYDRSMTEV